MRDILDFWSDGEHSRFETKGAKRITQRLKITELSRNICFGDKGGGSAPQADPQIGKAALENAQLGKDWLSFAKEQYGVGNERQSEIDKLTNQVTQQQLDTQDKSNARADEQWQQYNQRFAPIEQQVATEAMNYDSPEKQAEAAGQARADVQSAADTQRQITQRTAAAQGINPGSGRYAGVDRAAELTTAVQAAGAENKARDTVKNMGIMLRKDAASLGRGMTGTAAQSYGVGLNAGNSAVGNITSANQSWANNNAAMAQGFQGNIGANNSAASILNQQYGNQVNAYNAQQQAESQSAAGIGSMVGTLGAAFL